VRIAFLEAVTDAVARGRLRLLVGIRSDFSDLLLKACREADPGRKALEFDRESYYTLLPFDAEKAESVINRMLARDETLPSDPLLQQQREEFAGELVKELLRPPGDTRLCREDEKRVLPVELQMVGWTYETVLGGRFSASELKRRGGKVGLYRDYIADAKDYVFRKTGVRGETALLVLRRLISPAGTKWAQSVAEVSRACGGLSLAQVDDVLRAFAERYLVRRLPDEETDDATDRAAAARYELMHEHMVQLLREAPEPALQKLRDAEARLRFWRERTRHLYEAESKPQPQQDPKRQALSRLRALYRSPIPAGEIWGLWRYAKDHESRRMLQRSLRGYLAWSLTYLAFLIALVTAREIHERSPSYQVEYVIRNAPVEVVGRDSSGDANAAFEAYFTALGNGGRFPRAMQEASRVVNPEYRAWALAAVAQAAGRLKQKGEAKAAIDEALGALAYVEGQHSQGPAYRAVCEAAVATGQFDAMMDDVLLSEEVVNEESNSSSGLILDELLVLAKAAGQAGQAIHARRALEAAFTQVDPTEPVSSSNYQQLAHSAAEAGQLDLAMRSAAHVRDPRRQASAYKAVAHCAAKAGHFDEALNAAAQVKHRVVQWEAYGDIAEAAANAGRIDTALSVAALVTDPWFRSNAYVAVAEAARKKNLGQSERAIEEALRAASRIEPRIDQDRASRAGAYLRVAEVATAAKLEKPTAEAIEGALDAAARFKDPYYVNAIHVLLARTAARAGAMAAANEAVARILDAYDRCRAHVAVAEERAGKVPVEEVRTAIEQALKTAEVILTPVEHYDAYEAIARAASRAELLEVMVDAITTMTRHYARAQAGAAAAEAAAEAGLERQARTLFEKALQAVDVRQTTWPATPAERIRLYAAVVNSAIAAGMLDIASRAEEKMPDDADEKSPAQAAIAAALARSGKLYEARVYSERCERMDKLQVYTEILREYDKRHFARSEAAQRSGGHRLDQRIE
jgi:hypothetical protein